MGKKTASARSGNERNLRLFAVGQLGWAILSGVISNWLVYYYMPSESMLSQGMKIFITQGVVFAGLTVIVFISPVDGESAVNNVALFVSLMLFYITLSLYCTPFNALIPELGRSQEDRINLSTYISVTYFIGTAMAYTVTAIDGLLEPMLGAVWSFRATVGILALIAIACMLVPAFGIDEKTACGEAVPSSTPMGESVVRTFKNRDFQVFELSDVLYWVSITMFQTGLPYYITELMGFDDSMTFVFFALMTVVSLVFYAPVNILAKKLGKKKLVVFAFFFFCVAFAVTSACGQFGIPAMVWGVLVAVLAAVPMAVLGILPQAVLADIAEADAVEQNEHREGMFYAARTFSMTLGQTLAMILFTSIPTAGTFGYRATALVATAFCLVAAVVFTRYRESRVLGVIGGTGHEAGEE